LFISTSISGQIFCNRLVGIGNRVNEEKRQFAVAQTTTEARHLNATRLCNLFSIDKAELQ